MTMSPESTRVVMVIIAYLSPQSLGVSQSWIHEMQVRLSLVLAASSSSRKVIASFVQVARRF